MQSHDNNGELKLHCWENFCLIFLHCQSATTAYFTHHKYHRKKTLLSSFSSHPAAQMMTDITPE